MSNALRTLASISAFFSKTFALWVIAFALISYYFPQGFYSYYHMYQSS